MRFVKKVKEVAATYSRVVIFVEGQDDAYFLDKLIDDLGGREGDVSVIPVDGDGAIKTSLKGLFMSAANSAGHIHKVITIVDADTDAEKKVADLSRIYKRYGFEGVRHGVISKSSSGVEGGVYIWPNGSDAGEIEDLFEGLVKDDEKYGLISGVFDKINEMGPALDKKVKRKMRMYLSVLEIKPCGVGRAYRDGVFKNEEGLGDIKIFMEQVIS